MSAPSNPTLSELVAEALKKAGEYDPSTDTVDRAEDKWMEEIKQDIWRRGKKLKNLMITSHGVATIGKSRYSNPSDYSSDLSITLLDGNIAGTATAGGSASLTLQAGDGSTEELIIGKDLLITGGTGLASLSRIVSYNESTRVATVSPNFKSTPASSSTYLIVDYEYEVKSEHMSNYQYYVQTYRDRPTIYFPVGDEDYGEFIFNCPPDKAYGIRFNYYANIMKMDLSSTWLSNLYLQWRNVWIHGIMWKKFQDANDDRESMYFQLYNKEINDLVNLETYGADISNITDRITDFN